MDLPDSPYQTCDRPDNLSDPEFWTVQNFKSYTSEELGYEALNITDTDHTDLENYHCIIHDTTVLPRWERLPSKKGILLPTSHEGLNEIYPDNDQYKCTMFVMPYRVFNFKDVMIEE